MSRRNFRRRRESSSSSNDGNKSGEEETVEEEKPSRIDVSEKAAYIRERQKLRQRPNGITLDKLAFDKPLTSNKYDKKESEDLSDPFKLKTGGLIDTKKLKRKADESEDQEGEETISKLFAAETNRRDEDADMLKFIEEELSRRRGDKKEELAAKSSSSTEDVLNKVPDYLRPGIGKASEGMMSQQMLCGIPEVDLGVAAKMKNIEATEEAKQKLIRERLAAAQRGKDVSDLVPSNVAANFVQHSRWKDQADVAAKMESLRKARQHAEFVAQAENMKKTWRVGDYENVMEDEKRKLENEKSSDNYHLQKFKQQMQNRKK